MRAARFVLTPVAALLVIAAVAPPAGSTATATKFVSIGDNFFSPKNTTIAKGSSVKWTNNGTRNHTASKSSGGWSSGTLEPGETFTKTFTVRGTIFYKCKIHPATMKGTVKVT